MFFPLTRNTNINNIKAAGSADIITTEDYLTKPTDCTYADTVSTSSVGSSTCVFHLAPLAILSHFLDVIYAYMFSIRLLRWAYSEQTCTGERAVVRWQRL